MFANCPPVVFVSCYHKLERVIGKNTAGPRSLVSPTSSVSVQDNEAVKGKQLFAANKERRRALLFVSPTRKKELCSERDSAGH